MMTRRQWSWYSFFASCHHILPLLVQSLVVEVVDSAVVNEQWQLVVVDVHWDHDDADTSLLEEEDDDDYTPFQSWGQVPHQEARVEEVDNSCLQQEVNLLQQTLLLLPVSML